MLEDPQWELALLATVQSFYQRLLSDQLGGELPAPAELAPDVIGETEDVRSTLDKMHLWIKLLDMAITPAMLRLAVQPGLDPEVAEGLLRYFCLLYTSDVYKRQRLARKKPLFCASTKKMHPSSSSF